MASISSIAGRGTCTAFSGEKGSIGFDDNYMQYLERNREELIERVIGQERLALFRALGIDKQVGDAVCPVTTDDGEDNLLPATDEMGRHIHLDHFSFRLL